MAYLDHFLFSQSVLLSLNSQEKEAAVEEILELLKTDDRVTDWDKLHDSILERPAFSLPTIDNTVIIIYHGRTDSVEDLMIAVGRSEKGILFDDSEQLAHLIFVIAIPHQLNNEYLRAMGTIARLCKNPNTLEMLLGISDVEQFINILTQKSLE